MTPTKTLACFALAMAVSCAAELALAQPSYTGRNIQLKASAAFTPVEADQGDTIEFQLVNGQTRRIEVGATELRLRLSNMPQRKVGVPGGGIVLEMRCQVTIDGHPWTLRRLLPDQSSLAEPYLVNGMRLWFDGIRDIEKFLNENHGVCFPKRDVRLALQDATLSLCPEPMALWYPNRGNYIDVRESYDGGDLWMGPYMGADAHGGLDINMPVGTVLSAPFPLDTQEFESTVLQGKSNSWRATRRWDNGDRWKLRVGHIVQPLATGAVSAGTPVAIGAGTRFGVIPHSHFELTIETRGEQIRIDPWMLFWQSFEERKQKTGALIAAFAPLSPAKTGDSLRFKDQSRISLAGGLLRHTWAFGDGCVSTETNPEHVYAKPGLYAVTLTVEDGLSRESQTQLITVDGEPIDQASLSLSAPYEVNFRRRNPSLTDTYGQEPHARPQTIEILARPDGVRQPRPKYVFLENEGASELPKAEVNVSYEMTSIDVHGQKPPQWLNVSTLGKGNQQKLVLSAYASNLKPGWGFYRAIVKVATHGALNAEQQFRVVLEVPRRHPASQVVIDDSDPRCDVSPGYWFRPTFWKLGNHGVKGSYLTSGQNPDAVEAAAGHFVRYRPDLASGTYLVRFSDETNFDPLGEGNSPRFLVRIHDRRTYREGETFDYWAQPQITRTIGVMQIEQGNEAYVEIRSEGAEGMIVADALVFERTE